MDEPSYRNEAMRDAAASPRRIVGCRSAALTVLLVLGIVVIAVLLLLPVVQAPLGPSHRSWCRNNLMQISIALRNYEVVHGGLPPAYTTDADGTRLHSWRTLILPFMEQSQLCDSIDLTKPWDDPANAAALNSAVDVYQCPSMRDPGSRTTYLAVVTSNSCIRATEPGHLSSVTDDPRQTLLVIEVGEDNAVPWISPYDADEDIVLGLVGSNASTTHLGGLSALFFDGGVEIVPNETTTDELRAMISIAGNDDRVADSEKTNVD
jgi:hypothetical protein